MRKDVLCHWLTVHRLHGSNICYVWVKVPVRPKWAEPCGHQWPPVFQPCQPAIHVRIRCSWLSLCIMTASVLRKHTCMSRPFNQHIQWSLITLLKMQVCLTAVKKSTISQKTKDKQSWWRTQICDNPYSSHQDLEWPKARFLDRHNSYWSRLPILNSDNSTFLSCVVTFNIYIASTSWYADNKLSWILRQVACKDCVE